MERKRQKDIRQRQRVGRILTAGDKNKLKKRKSTNEKKADDRIKNIGVDGYRKKPSTLKPRNEEPG